MSRGQLRALGLVLTLGLSGCGSDRGQEPIQPTDTRPLPSRGPDTAQPGDPSAAARWETVATLSGTGTQDYDVIILPTAIQWRVRWSCETGALRIETTPPPRRGGPLVETGCPGRAEAFSIQTGPTHLGVEASGPWRVIVDQQVDTPLAEPPPPGAASATVLAEGSFYDIERQGRGRALLYRFADDRRILRFEDFEVSQNTDLFVWLSEASSPGTSAEATSAPKVQIANLKSTVGSQNYELPADIPTERVRSVVIWCEPVAVAYSAAAMSS